MAENGGPLWRPPPDPRDGTGRGNGVGMVPLARPYTPAVVTWCPMPETGNEIDTALKELSARYKDATDRARELTDAWVRYLVAINGGAIGITFGLASAYSNSPVSPAVFVWPVGAFTAGLICAGVAVFRERDRQDQRANKRV